MTLSDRNLPVTGETLAEKMQPVALDRLVDLGPPLMPAPTGYGQKGLIGTSSPNATKYDGDKLRWSLVMVSMRESLLGVVAIANFGAKKYADDAWMDVPNAQQRYLDAMYRHLDNIAERGHQSTDIDMQPDGCGGLVDKGSGYLEWFHVAWNALALSWFAVQEAKRQAREATR